MKYGANENFERMTRISSIRAGKEIPVFKKGNQPLNRYTLIELIVAPHYNFPDLANVKIDRLDEDGKKSRIITVNVEEMLKSGDCGKNIWLEWGDVVEIPELDHRINENWSGYPKEFVETMQKCLERQISITVKGEMTNVIFRPTIMPQGYSPPFRADYRLSQSLSSYLRASSDRSRIRVNRIDPVTKQSHEIIVNLEMKQEPDLWLLDGDEIEIPERDPNTPPAASSNSSGSLRSIPPRTLQISPGSPLPLTVE